MEVFHNNKERTIGIAILRKFMRQDIKILIMDVDGTLTDGKIYMGDKGELMKAFNIKDGCGIHDILIPKGIVPIIMTGRESKIVENRCNELGITMLYQGIKLKIYKLEEIIKNSKIEYSNVAYIGDDVNDLECMKVIKEKGGLVGCPSDAALCISTIVDFVSSKKGGEGAVREFIEWIVY